MAWFTGICDCWTSVAAVFVCRSLQGKLQRKSTEEAAVFVGHCVKTSEPSDSDHNAILFVLSRSDQDQPAMRILSWNILCKYGYNEQWGFAFDGWNRRFEAASDYLLRLERTALQVTRFVDTHHPHAVFLQECAEKGEFGHGVIGQVLKEHLSPSGYTILECDEFVIAIRSASAHALDLPTTSRQEKKIQAVYSEELAAVFLNVHLLWDHKDNNENKEATRQSLHTIVSHVRTRFPRAQIYLAGDTNRVLDREPRTDPNASTIEELGDGLGTVIYPPGPTNVRWSGEEKGSEMTYADFAIVIAPGILVEGSSEKHALVSK